MNTIDLLDDARALQDFCDKCGWLSCFIGGIAAGPAGVSRLTTPAWTASGSCSGTSIGLHVNFHEVDRDQQGADPAEAQDYLRTAVQHQLGLKLEPRKQSMRVLIVDHIERPSRDGGLPRRPPVDVE